jgi:hypothetical protein
MIRLEHILWSLLSCTALAIPACYASDDRDTDPPADVSADDDVADVDASDPPPPEEPVVAMYGPAYP